METAATWFTYFIIYSFVGYVWEVLFCSLKSGRLENRGYLFGPVCPIYGYGCVISIAVCHFLNWPLWANILAIGVVCDFIEYMSSLVMEKLFHMRWWDYTNKTRFNLNGRISLPTTLGFMFGGSVVNYLVHPYISAFIESLPLPVLFTVAVIAAVLLIIDTIFSSIATASLKDNLKGGHVDLTREIKKYAVNYYRKSSRRRRQIAKQTIRRMKKAQRDYQRSIRRAQKKATENWKKMKREMKKNLKELEAASAEYQKNKERMKKERAEYLAARRAARKNFRLLSHDKRAELKTKIKDEKKKANKIEK